MRGTLMAVASAALLAAIVPASAEDAFIGVPGVAGVEIGNGHYGDHGWRSDRYRTEGFDRREGFERCRTIVIRHSNRMTTKERRCRD
jgi:hypothetical protein